MLSAADVLFRARVSSGDESRQPSDSHAVNNQIIRARLELRNLLSQIIGFAGILLEEASDKGWRPSAMALHHTAEAAHLLLIHVDEKLDPYRLSQYKAFELQNEVTVFGRQTLVTMQRLATQLNGDLTPLVREDIAHINKAAAQMLELAENAIGSLAHLEIEVFLAEVRDAGRVQNRMLGETARPPLTSSVQQDESATGSVLVVDDSHMSRAILEQVLRRYGYEVTMAESGPQALELLRAKSFDVVLLDMLMPEMGGNEVLRSIKDDPALRENKVVMVSASDGIDIVARCIEAGAEDYLIKPINSALLRARVNDCIERKRLRDRERQTMHALVESQRRLADELAEAAAYVRSLLPPPLDGPITTRWRFIPSRQLGGDAFGYEWIDSERFAFYLLDVSGHGLRAALLSISLMNMLRIGGLRQTDYTQPAEVLTQLNVAFPMERHHNMYFSIWYGVYDRGNRTLTYANAGHPPALLSLPGGQVRLEKLSAHGPVIGALPHHRYTDTSREIAPNSQLFLFSDGAYEIRRPDGSFWEFEDFVALLSRQRPSEIDFEHVMALTRRLQGSDQFADDYSLLSVHWA